mgnify:FL=1
MKKDIHREESKIVLSYNSYLEGNIQLDIWEIILKENASFSGNIIMKEGSITLEKWATIFWDIITEWTITLWENSKIHWNISKDSELKKHSTSKVTGEKPSLFVTTNYPNFLKYFDVLPQKHKEAFGYIFLTSHNMDIRWKDLKPEDYYKKIFTYKDDKLEEINKINNPDLLKTLYKKSKKYINIIPERNVWRFWVWFVTKNYAVDKNFADMYISEYAAWPVLFTHEAGHVLDYKYNYIDSHNPAYPYPDKESSITEYWKFHKWEDFAEAYRYYILHYDSFKRKISENSKRQKKYDYLKKYVFEGKEYN